MIHVVYSAATGRVRRWIVGVGVENVATAAGEALLSIDGTDYGDVNKLQTLVTTHCGKTPENDRFVVVDAKGDVVGSLIADLSCGDSVPACRLIESETAIEGWKYEKGAFIEPAKPVITDKMREDYAAAIASAPGILL